MSNYDINYAILPEKKTPDPKLKNIHPKTSETRPIFCTGNFSDEGVDLDGDLLYDHILLYIEVKVTQIFPNVTIIINLEPQLPNGTPIGNRFDVSKSFHWKDIGIHNLSMSLINASRFHILGQNLMFHIHMIRITRIHELYKIPISVYTHYDSYTTQVYSHVNFDVFISLISNIRDRSEDIDFNWRFDYIIIEFSIEILQDGNYRTEMTFKPETGEAFTRYNVSTFEKGMNAISIRLDADSVRAFKINSSLNVTMITIKDGMGIIVYKEYPNYLTHTYSYTEFDVHSIMINGNEDFRNYVDSEKLKGKGNSLEPYIISDLIVTDKIIRENVIDIRNVDIYFQIINNMISHNERAILIENVSHCLIVNNDLLKNEFGILLDNTNECIVKDNRIKKHDVGLSLYYADNNVIDCNVFDRNTVSIKTYESNDNTIVNNSISGRTGDTADIGLQIGAYSNNNLIIQNDFQNNDIDATDLGLNNIFQSNYWKDWEGVGYFWIPGEINGKPNSNKSCDRFPVKNPNHIVGPIIISPSTKTYLDAIIPINWEALDTLGFELLYDIYYSMDNELKNDIWSLLIAELPRTHFEWEVRDIPEGNYRIKIVAYDSLGFTSWKISDLFTIQTPINPAPIIHPLLGIIVLVLVSIYLKFKYT